MFAMALRSYLCRHFRFNVIINISCDNSLKTFIDSFFFFFFKTNRLDLVVVLVLRFLNTFQPEQGASICLLAIQELLLTPFRLILV